MRLERLGSGPIIDASSHPTLGGNINGPSLIEVPPWVDEPLGRYYLYFSHHKGDHIRLAFADRIEGPWTVHPGGVLSLADSRFLSEPPPVTDEELSFFGKLYEDMSGERPTPERLHSDVVTPHIASPDVRVDDRYRAFSMYFHGLDSLGVQLTRHATSLDGLDFDVDPPTIDGTYLRAFRHHETDYAMVMPGRLLRRTGRPTEFEEGPELLPPEARHCAVLVRGDDIHIFWTRVGDAPERILASTVDGRPRWTEWSAGAPVELMRPEARWEGADEPVAPSVRGDAPGLVNQLRDPAIFESGGRVFLVCAVGGESGLALNELHL